MNSTSLQFGPGRYSLDSHRLIDRATGQITYHAKQGGARQSYPDSFFVQSNRTYFEADKTIGSIPASTLINVALDNLVLAESVDTHEACEFYELAGSALIEASFSAQQQPLGDKHPVDTQDEGLYLIDEGLDALRHAIQSLGHDDNSTYKQRLRLKLDFEHVYKDIVCEELTNDTVQDMRDILFRHLLATYHNDDPVHARGFGGEIRKMIEHWNAYRRPGDDIVIPATSRGDCGVYHREQTHDLDVLFQDDTSKWQTGRPIEVKRRKIKQWMLRRYTQSDLYYIRTDGTSSLANPSI